MAFNYRINGVPDLDQRWDGLGNNGRNHCVPTSTMNWMYHLEATAFPSTLSFPTTLPNHVPSNISVMGTYMDTDPDEGTNHADGIDGLCDWLDDHDIPAVVCARTALDGDNCTYAGLRNLLKAGAHMVVKMGRYRRDDGEFERTNGHAMSVVGLQRWDTGRIEITVNDPAQDDGNINAQTPAGTTRKVALDEGTWNIEGDDVTVLRWGTSNNPFRFIDGWTGILPLTLITNLNSTSLTSYRIDLGSGDAISTDYPYPFEGGISDLALNASATGASVIATRSGEVWTLDLIEGRWSKAGASAGALRLTYGGRRDSLFVSRADTVQALDEQGQLTGELHIGQGIDAISYNAAARELLIATSGNKLFRVSPKLRLTGNDSLPEISGQGRLNLSVARDGAEPSLVLSRDGSTQLINLALKDTGSARPLRLRAAASPTAIHANRRGRVFVSDHGRLATYNTAGQRTRLRSLDGLPVGPLVKVSRTVNDLDRDRLARRELRS